ncbi:MAG: HD domain-containing phosphohydrolase [Chloroflexota bacterium]
MERNKEQEYRELQEKQSLPRLVEPPQDPLATIQLEAIFGAFPDMLFHMRADGTILENRFGRKTRTYMDPSEIIGKNIALIFPEDVGQQFNSAIQQVQSGGKTIPFEYDLIIPEGKRCFEARLISPEPDHVVAVIRDITEHKLTEERLRRQLQRLASLRSIDTIISSSFDLKLALTLILDQVISQLAVNAACVLTFNPVLQTLEYVAGRGFHSDEPQQTLRLGNDYAGLAIIKKQIITINNLGNRQTNVLRKPGFIKEGFVSYFGVPLIAKGQVKGVLEIFHRSALQPDSEWLDFMQTLAGQIAIAIDSATLFDNLQQTNSELILAYDATIEGWSRALDMRGKETEGHTKHVTELTIHLSRLMGVKEEELNHIRHGALLHDMGKLTIPDTILQKAGPLDDSEWEIMRQHPRFAYEMLSPIEYLRKALDIPHYHHEKWDGTGYPYGLQGDQIPLAARIFAVADVFDSLTSDSPYRPAISKQDAIAYIQEQSGKHFDPRVVNVFMKYIDSTLVTW